MKELDINIENLFHFLYLNEEQHVVREFELAAKYIVKNIKNFKEDCLEYTGWNWHISTKNCIYDNNENSGFPIYICIKNFDDNTKFASLENRDLINSKIIINVNKYFKDDFSLYSKLMHEFTHCRTSYSNYDKDILQNKKHLYNIKNIDYYIDLETNEYSLDKFENSIEKELFNQIYFLKARNILYFISQTEQDARINQLYQYLNENINQFKNTPKSIIIEEIIKKTSDISLILDFRGEIEKLFNDLNTNNYKILLCISYYLNKLCQLHNNLDDTYMLKIFNIVDGKNYKYTANDSIIANETYNFLYDKLQKYQRKIYDIISKIFIDKG